MRESQYVLYEGVAICIVCGSPDTHYESRGPHAIANTNMCEISLTDTQIHTHTHTITLHPPTHTPAHPHIHIPSAAPNKDQP